MRLAIVLLLSSLSFAQGMGGKSGIGGKAGFGGGAAVVTGPTFVQAANATSGSGHPDLTATFGGGTASGNAVVVYGAWASSPAPTMAGSNVTVAGGTCSVLDSVTDAGGTSNGLYFCTGVTAGTTAVTLNLTTDATMNAAASIANAVVVLEVHGASAKDGSNHAANSAGSTSANADVCSTGFTPGTSNDLILGGFTDRASINNSTWTAGTSPITFTIPANGQVSNKVLTIEYGSQAVAAAIIPAITDNSADNYDAVCAGLK